MPFQNWNEFGAARRSPIPRMMFATWEATIIEPVLGYEGTQELMRVEEQNKEDCDDSEHAKCAATAPVLLAMEHFL
jgi:hypothetical protein